MTKLLYRQDDPKDPINNKLELIPKLDMDWGDIFVAFASLDDNVKAYNSISVVKDHIASENYNYIDKGNYVLYNEYIQFVTSNLGIKPVTVSQEALTDYSSLVLTHTLSLEGLIGDIWAKIKGLFSKIYESIKAFFTTYFTKLGRLKKKLSNVLSVLEKTDKDIKKLNLDSVPSGLGSKYPYSGDITFSTVSEVFTNTKAVATALTSINTVAKKLASVEVLDADFVAKIKSLRDLSKASGEQIDKNNDNKTEGIKSLYGEGKRTNKALDSENKSLSEIQKGSEKEANAKEGEAASVVNSSDNIGITEDNDEGFNKAKKEFQEFIKGIEKDLSPLKGKGLISGNTITNIVIKEDSGIELELDKDKETPSGITLESKSKLVTLIKDTIALLESTEDVSKNYSQINDTIMKNMDSIDKIVRDIDAIKMESLGKYKTVLTKKVRERLMLMKSFFSNYNKVNKTFFQVIMETAQGNADYGLLSLKYFG